MMSEVSANKETLGFQAEVSQLLDLMVHSLYSNKEIFLRELISNASDAADKLRFEAIADESLLENNPELSIRVDFDSDARTISIKDNGIGMSREDARTWIVDWFDANGLLEDVREAIAPAA